RPGREPGDGCQLRPRRPGRRRPPDGGRPRAGPAVRDDARRPPEAARPATFVQPDPEQPQEQELRMPLATARKWTCAGCGVSASRSDAEAAPLPESWEVCADGTFCLGCRRQRAAEAAV